KVASPAQKEQATAIVSQVPGVSTVNNLLTLVASQEPSADPFQTGAPAGRPDIQQTGFAPKAPLSSGSVEKQKKSNQAVAQSIADALTKAGLSGYEIEIRYQNGVATLG